MLNKLKIQSGILKGKSLISPSNLTTRSTKSIVQDSFFDTIRDEIKNKDFIEVFGGSGIMAATALSNGANHAYAIEIDKSAYKILSNNFALLNSDKITALFGNSLQITPNLISKNAEKSVILYIDPPFNTRENFANIYEQIWQMLSSLDKNKIYLIAIEHISSYNPPQTNGDFIKFKSKKFGKTTLSYFKVIDD